MALYKSTLLVSLLKETFGSKTLDFQRKTRTWNLFTPLQFTEITASKSSGLSNLPLCVPIILDMINSHDAFLLQDSACFTVVGLKEIATNRDTKPNR